MTTREHLLAEQTAYYRSYRHPKFVVHAENWFGGFSELDFDGFFDAIRFAKNSVEKEIFVSAYVHRCMNDGTLFPCCRTYR